MVPAQLLYGQDCFSFYTLICLPSSRKYTFSRVTGIPFFEGILFKKACKIPIFREIKPSEDLTR